MQPDRRSIPKNPSIELEVLSASVLEALASGSIERASAAFGRPLPQFFLEFEWLWALRRTQLEERPDTERWLVRAIVDRSTGDIVGHAGFHGPPDESGMVEIGYTIAEPFRRRGYGRATVGALIEIAEADPAVQTVRASISPDNTASLATIRPFDFALVGEQMDDIDGLELIFERPARR
jgi:RimJ/RimL family protein N-acetyltransferase